MFTGNILKRIKTGWRGFLATILAFSILGVFLFVGGRLDENKPKDILKNPNLGANWRSYGKKFTETTNYHYFYSKDSIVRPNKDVIKVWVKYVATDEVLKTNRRNEELEREKWEAGREKRKVKKEREKAELRKKGDFDTLRRLSMFEELRSRFGGTDDPFIPANPIEKEKTLLFEMKCSERTFRILECSTNYESGWSYYESIEVSPGVIASIFPTIWHNIYVDTPIEALYQAVCRRTIFPW